MGWEARCFISSLSNNSIDDLLKLIEKLFNSKEPKSKINFNFEKVNK